MNSEKKTSKDNNKTNYESTLELLKTARKTFSIYAINTIQEEADGRNHGITKFKSIAEGYEVLDLIDKAIIDNMICNTKYQNVANVVKYFNKNIVKLLDENDESNLRFAYRDLAILMSLKDKPINSFEILDDNINAAANDYTDDSDVLPKEAFIINMENIVPDERDYKEEKIFKDKEL
ncbi:hypothetical protein UFOVP495_10 [uncultured Caudovirales phage]|uniref:Uncharacterized protein n=1 Tax=uncultured Caudovirales phage TaxID=2100421 RepID=A0A6J5MS84_9CAUD|nr:hypothetical protein UFOVP495_10 [uncultured Caudovirales phage]